MTELDQIKSTFEEKQNVKIIFSSLVGSKLRGYDCESSNADVQFIQFPKGGLKDYVLGKSQGFSRYNQNKYDIESCDLREVIFQLRNHNPKFYEMIYHNQERDDKTSQFLNYIADLYFNYFKLANIQFKIGNNFLSEYQKHTDKEKRAKMLIEVMYSLLASEFLLTHKKMYPINILTLIESFSDIAGYRGILSNGREGYSKYITEEDFNQVFNSLKSRLSVIQKKSIDLRKTWESSVNPDRDKKIEEALFQIIVELSEDYYVSKKIKFSIL